MNKKFIPKQPKGISNKNLCLIYIFIILNYVILYIWRPEASDRLEMELMLAVRQWMWVLTMKPYLLEEQYLLSTAEPPLQAPALHFLIIYKLNIICWCHFVNGKLEKGVCVLRNKIYHKNIDGHDFFSHKNYEGTRMPETVSTEADGEQLMPQRKGS